jgi:3-dehydroquinate synthase/2-deoxy-scyllo-inosose synthase
MGMTDVVLSIKQAVNSEYGKNQIGAYYAPFAVFADYNFLKTLPLEEFNCGIAEFIKNLVAIEPGRIGQAREILNGAVCYSPEQFRYILDVSVEAKCKVMANDLYEEKDGFVLEYGHGIAHALEHISQGEVRHGEAVAFGMLVAAEASRSLGYLSDSEVEVHYDLIIRSGLFEQIAYISRYDVLGKVFEVLKHDSKRGYIADKAGYVPSVILETLGTPLQTNGFCLHHVPRSEVRNALETVLGRLRSVRVERSPTGPCGEEPKPVRVERSPTVGS